MKRRESTVDRCSLSFHQDYSSFGLCSNVLMTSWCLDRSTAHIPVHFPLNVDYMEIFFCSKEISFYVFIECMEILST